MEEQRKMSSKGISVANFLLNLTRITIKFLPGNRLKTSAIFKANHDIVKYLLIASALLAISCSPKEEPNTSLFNGENLDGWHLYNEGKTPSIWTVENGLITCDPSNEGEYGDLVTDLTYEGDFTFTCDWRVDSAGNSGIFFHVLETESLAAPWMSGIEYQVLDHSDTINHNYGDPMRMSGALYGFQELPEQTIYHQGDWNQTEVRMEGSTITYFLNGVQTAQMDLNSPEWKLAVSNSKFEEYGVFGQPRNGRIGLQAWKGRVQFKNLQLVR